MTKAVARREEAPAPAPIVEPGDKLLDMIQKIMSTPDLPAERVQQAIDFYKQVDGIAAKKAFDAAMASAKAEFEPIVKRHTANRGEKGGSYKFEDLADINEAVDPVLAKYGLNTRYRATSNPNEPIKVTCIVTHTQGHSEETTLAAGADTSGGKNSIQGIGSTTKYLMRYTKLLSLGFAAGRDDDGQASGQGEFITEDQLAKIQSEIVDVGADIPKLCNALKVERLDLIPANKYEAAMVVLDMKRRAKK